MRDNKPNRAELVRMLHDVISANTRDPATEIIAMGEAMVAVGKSLEGVSVADAKAIIAAVKAMEG